MLLPCYGWKVNALLSPNPHPNDVMNELCATDAALYTSLYHHYLLRTSPTVIVCHHRSSPPPFIYPIPVALVALDPI